MEQHIYNNCSSMILVILDRARGNTGNNHPMCDHIVTDFFGGKIIIITFCYTTD
uniref:Uncharacterized protein n=1 Tax=Anguilla anguilla TaxID=7936 RepID=A0A0E9RBP7_ANGAN